ncbi:acetylserotonin O-methyltransferase 1-like [Oryza brachyantha]|uniref:acetylserotonin O-methyltransferase 1-like n=1 Tax=Oryza brachyantha TaxID=4533 RepID=UPI001AD9C7D6|nr:acetylserotonin O-methyltransferase 1-like [Oryza brachyantha]
MPAVAALVELNHHVLGYVKSMALKCAVDLGVPGAIHRRGGAASLADIAADTAVHPSKLADLQRLMEMLSTTGIFSSTIGAADINGDGGGGGGAVAYRLTAASRVLVGSRSLSPEVQFVVCPHLVSSFFSLRDWLTAPPSLAASGSSSSLFEVAHGCSQWEMAAKDSTLNSVLNAAMAAESQIFLEAVVAGKGRHVFGGLSSLVDVGGGYGAATEVIAREFPHIKCTVLDLPHVVSQAPVTGDGKVHFVAGDMFESVPRADAVVLKNILHDWSDDDCVKILQRCKEAIPGRNAGGKVIIMDMVRGSGPRDKGISEMEATRNLFMMHINGMERDEHEWKKIFCAAGFSNDCQIIPVLGPFAVIEIYS